MMQDAPEAAHAVDIDGASIAYDDVGHGSTILFVHGVYVTGSVWDDVVGRLSHRYRCVCPTWPFGAHRDPLDSGTDLSVRTCAARIVRLLEALDLTEVTLVANDTGGGLVQAALGDPGLSFDRIARLVLTNCDSFEHFPPASFVPLAKLCQFSPAAGAFALRGLASGIGQAVFASQVTRHGIAKARRPRIFGGFLASSAVRRDAARFTAGLEPSMTLSAVRAMSTWQRPVLLAWGSDDKLFPLDHAQRLQQTFPNAAIRWINDSSTYVMLDQPAELARAIGEFIEN